MPIDTSLIGSAPPKRGTRAAPAPKKSVNDERTEAVNGIFQLAGFACIITGNYSDAAAITQYSPGISTEVVNLGQQNESIGRGIDYLNQVGPYAGLIAATMPLVLQMLANHRRLDYQKVPGLSSPEVLESKVKAQMAAQAAREMREAQQAQREYDAEMASMREVMEMDARNGQAEQPVK